MVHFGGSQMEKSDQSEPETTVGVAVGIGAPAQSSAAVDHFNHYRKDIKAIAGGVKWLKGELAAGKYSMVDGADRGEAIANLMLAYRHLEDASQRLGKAIQAADGGASVYDRETTVGA